MAELSEAQLPVLGGRYEVSTPLGSGSAANVFRVRDRRTGATRAAKILKPENAANPTVLARFEDEFRILRTLHHPHLPEVYDYGWTDDGGRFLIMELVDGVPLDEFFRSNPDDIWEILYELCETLTFVHNHKLLHQDIKPSNILVRRTTAFGPDLPLVKLIDFGLTYRRDAGAAVELVGTPEYMAPEVVRGDPSLTRAVDYYSLGATLYELLCGRPPFVGPESQVLRAHLQREPLIHEEELKWAELYPHMRALLTKDWRARLEAFEELRRAVTGRLTGGIEALDRAYGLARIDSLPMIGKEEVWKEMMRWLGEVRSGGRDVPTLHIEGAPGSGIGFMMNALSAEASIVRIPMVRLGSHMDFGTFLHGTRSQQPGSSVLEDASTAYDSLLRNLESPCLLVCVDRDTADENIVAFAKYLDALRDPPSSVALGMIEYGELHHHASTRAWHVQISPIAIEECERVVDRFCDSTPAEDVNLIRVTVGRAKTSGGIIDLLRKASELGALTFRGSRWVVRRDMAQSVDVHVRSVNSGARTVLASLPGSPLRVMACISCADYPVPISWLPSILTMRTDLVEKDLQALLVRRMVSVCDKGVPMAVSPSNDLLRNAAREMVSQNEVHRFHSALAECLRHGEPTGRPERRLLSLAAHYERLGMYRELAKYHLQAIRVLACSGVPGNADGEYERGIVWFARPEAVVNYSGAPAILRLYVKCYLNSLWSRNLYARARRLLHGVYVSMAVPMPASFWPKYVRSTLDIEGPSLARKLLCKLDVSNLRTTHELRLLIGLEDALVSLQEGRYEPALATIQELERHEARLDLRHRHRLRIYEAMYLQARGERVKADALLRRDLPRALEDGSVDEAVLMQAICAAIAIYRGDTEGGLRQVSVALRTARRHRLYLRANLLYRLAAAIYEHMGKYQRAIRAQLRAIQSAYTIEMMDTVAIGWQRLAEYNRAIGMFGSALRYIERAEASLANSSNASHWSQVNRLRYELAVNVRSSDRHELARRRSSWLKRITDVSERGNMELALGQYYQFEGQLVRARSHFASARSFAVKAGMPENAVVAAGAEVRTLYELGWIDQIDEPVRFVKRNTRGSSSINMRAEQCIVRMRSAYIARGGKQRVAGLANEAVAMWDDLESAKVRSEIALLLFRLFARDGQEEVARHWVDLYMAELRKMFANLKESAHAEGVAQLVGMNNAGAEIAGFMGRSRQKMKSAHGDRHRESISG
jgi:serine/threonine protein kinase/tetratricopeptide (TPR) repeat protein